MELELQQAISIAMHRQLYRQQQLTGKSGVLDLIRQLAYVQIDTISVVERAHHHTIWSRIGSYDKAWLDELLEKDRAIYEFWGHAASFLPMEDYRFSLHRMKRFPDTSGWERQFFDKYKHLLDDVLSRIKSEGPLGARDFPDTRPVKTDFGWGTGKPEKIALELLLWKGELMVSRRDMFQRIYDLTDRILPSWVDTSYPSEEELYSHLIMRSISAMGLASESDIRQHFMTGDKILYHKYLKQLAETGEIVITNIEGKLEQYYTLPGMIETVLNEKLPLNQLFLLSPFDNLVILRQRIRRLWGFDYTMECYVTPKKRIYGYWCLPILYRHRFIGRVDCKANRSAKQMELVSLHWEPGVKPDKSVKTALQSTFDRFADFCGCATIDIGKT